MAGLWTPKFTKFWRQGHPIVRAENVSDTRIVDPSTICRIRNTCNHTRTRGVAALNGDNRHKSTWMPHRSLRTTTGPAGGTSPEETGSTPPQPAAVRDCPHCGRPITIVALLTTVQAAHQQPPDTPADIVPLRPDLPHHTHKLTTRLSATAACRNLCCVLGEEAVLPTPAAPRAAAGWRDGAAGWPGGVHRDRVRADQRVCVAACAGRVRGVIVHGASPVHVLDRAGTVAAAAPGAAGRVGTAGPGGLEQRDRGCRRGPGEKGAG